MANRKALGRGLKALIPDPESFDTPEQARSVQEIPIKQIRANPYQPRQVFDPEAIEELRQSIQEKGVISPVIVRAAAEGYELIAGERRVRAVRELGYATIPAVIRKVETESEMLELSLIENIQREQLNPMEEARSYKSLITAYHYTQDQVAAKVGKKRATVANSIRLLGLPAAVQELIAAGGLSMGQARPLLSLKDGHDQERWARKIVKRGWSARQVEEAVRVHAGPGGKRAETPGRGRHRLSGLEDELQRALGTKVTIRERRGKGKIEIEFYSEEDLDRILEVLRKD